MPFTVGFCALFGLSVRVASPEEITMAFFSSSFSPTNYRTSCEIWEAESAGRHAVLTFADWAFASSTFAFFLY